MDINKWKSVAVRIDDYKILKALSHNRFRAPNAMISKLVNDDCEFQAQKQGISVEAYKKELINGKT